MYIYIYTYVNHICFGAHLGTAARRPGSSTGPSRFPTRSLVWVPRLGTGLWRVNPGVQTFLASKETGLRAAGARFFFFVH